MFQNGTARAMSGMAGGILTSMDLGNPIAGSIGATDEKAELAVSTALRG